MTSVLQNYTIEYRDVADADENWTSFEFESDESSQLLLSTLLPNRTYEARLFVNGHVVHGLRSRAVTFTTNNTGMARGKWGVWVAERGETAAMQSLLALAKMSTTFEKA